MLQMTLTPCREDRERYVRMVSYRDERDLEPSYDSVRVVALRREWRQLDGKGWKCVRVTTVRPDLAADRQWHEDNSTPELLEAERRDAVRRMRRALHVDPAKGAADPARWAGPLDKRRPRDDDGSRAP